MNHKSCLVIGGTGYVGAAIAQVAAQRGWTVTSVGRTEYANYVGAQFDLLINANGNSSRFRASQDLLFDFDASARTVYRSIHDFQFSHYALISTVDVYNDTSQLAMTSEDTPIELSQLCPYAFHKRLAELFVIRQCQRWQIFRLAQMVGTGLRKGPIFDLLHRKPLWIDDESSLHYMHTRHVADTIFDLVQRGDPDEIYNVCGTDCVPFRHVLDLIPPDQRPTERAGRARQMYHVNTDKTNHTCELPESWQEVRQFIAEHFGT